MAENLTQVLSNYIIYVDSTSLMHGNMEFFKISLYNVLKSTNRKIKVVDFVVKDLKRKQFSDSERFAVKALKILDYYRKANLVEDVVTSGIEDGKILDVIYNNRNVDKDDVCVITENKDVANEIVTNLRARKNIDFNYKIAAVRLINGPALWNIQTVKPRVMPITKEQPKTSNRVSFDSIKTPSFETPEYKDPIYIDPDYSTEPIEEIKIKPIEQIKIEPIPETIKAVDQTTREEPVRHQETPIRHQETQAEHKEEPKKQFKPINNSRQKRAKLVVSIIVDNSTSLNDERSALMKSALNNFYQRVLNSEEKSDLDLAVYGFDGFSPRVLKGYDGELDINRFDNGGIQVLGKTIELAMDDLVARQKLYKEHNIETHKPWLIILSDGGAYGDITEQVNKLKTVVKGRRVTYFPFCLSSMELDHSLEPLAKLKMFLKVRDNKFTELFNFLFNTLTQRINTPDEVHMTLDKQAIAGFIAR